MQTDASVLAALPPTVTFYSYMQSYAHILWGSTVTDGVFGVPVHDQWTRCRL